jgi:hypothetical protein
MGLSDEERYAKIVHSVARMTAHGEKLNPKTDIRETKKLKELVGQAWYCFLGGESDGAFWLLGSDLASDHLNAQSLAAVAFNCHVKHGDSKTWDELEAEGLAKQPDERAKYLKYLEIARDFTSMERLHEGFKGDVLMIYLETQCIAYAMCRYHDDFMKRLKDLNFLIRGIQGECFKLMRDDKEYAQAWMVHNLCDNILTYDDTDVVNQWWQKRCNHHDIKVHWSQFDEIYTAYKKYQWKDLTVQERLDLTLMLIGNKYGEFEHQHKQFLEMVKAYNADKKNKVKLNVKALENHWKKTSNARKEEKEKPYERHCEFTGNYVDHKGEQRNMWDFASSTKAAKKSIKKKKK